MSLRIIGGKLRNRPLKTPMGDNTRPTLAILRKAVFDISQGQIEDAFFLDLFAGSGAMGIEAISRGAKLATFVEKDRNALKCIRENLKALQIEEQSRVLASDVMQALKKCVEQDLHFDIIYIDPPYAHATSLLPNILTFIDTHDLLNPQALVFVEESSQQSTQSGTLRNLPLRHLIYLNTRTFSQSTLHQFIPKKPQKLTNRRD